MSAREAILDLKARMARSIIGQEQVVERLLCDCSMRLAREESDGTYTLSYTVYLENSGDVPLSSVQIVDDLATTFAGATGFVVDSVTSGDFAVNAGFNGETGSKQSRRDG